MLLSCGRIIQNKLAVCIVRKLELQTTGDGVPLLTEFKCPQLLLTNDLYIFPTSIIRRPVSIVHVCSDSCKFTTISTVLSFTHDLSKNLYCLYIYCIGNNK